MAWMETDCSKHIYTLSMEDKMAVGALGIVGKTTEMRQAESLVS